MNTLMRYSPSRTMMNLRREVDRLFDELRSGSTNGADGEHTSALWTPRTDVSETETEYTLRMDMPGIDRDDLVIELEEGTLTVSGSRESRHEESKETYHRIERTHGHFFRSFTLPKASDAENVSAELDDGVLTIHVPKREESRPRRIEIS